MIYYGVHSTFYNNGKTSAYMVQYDLNKKPENKVVNERNCDRYTDYYTNKKDAEKAVDEARNA